MTALKMIKDLLTIQDKVHSSLISKAKTHYAAYEIASLCSRIEEANEHIRTIRFVYSVCSAICPYSANTATCLKVINNI